MTTFEIEGKEYELKLTFESVKKLSKVFDGGSYEVVGLALAGDLDAFPAIVHAGLIHTGKNFTRKQVDKAIEEAFESEKLTLDDIAKVGKEVVADNFFYKPTVQKLLKKNPDAKKAMKAIHG